MANFRPVTPAEIQLIVAAARNGASLSALQRDFNRSPNTLKKVLQAHDMLPQESFDGLIPTSVLARRLGISLQAITRLVRVLDIKPATSRMGGWFFTPEQADAMAGSDSYKAVLASRIHRKHARAIKVRVKFPFQPDALPRCVACRNLCPGRICSEREITISRLSVRSAFHQCQFFAGKETAPMK